ncbi:conserved hypothetical protein [Ricinus communis]|uniref:Uncharacterized protein n=1 Tax=Ricinus communis TaxID=3988 RepID=B9SC10_RICCO|nr:conserved hypothetical protein [Ricinus communis]
MTMNELRALNTHLEILGKNVSEKEDNGFDNTIQEIGILKNEVHMMQKEFSEANQNAKSFTV